MKFSEEYKSAMNEITPDEKAAERIERAVLDKIAEKPAKPKRKNPVFIGTAVSGAAVCAAIACVFIFRTSGFSGGSLNNAICTDSKMYSQSYDGTLETVGSAEGLVSSSSASVDAADNEKCYPSAGFSSAATKSEQCKADDEMNDVVWDGETVFTLEFTADGGVIVKKGGYCEEFEPTCLVERFSSPQKDLSLAISDVGEKRFIRVDGYRLYLFDDDLQTAKYFKKQ